MSEFIFVVIFVTCAWGLITPAAADPQIFTQTHSYCKYELSRSKNGVKMLTFANKIWTIERRDFNLYFTFCKSRINQCPEGSSGCLVWKSKSGVINLGNEFLRNVNLGEFILESTGSQCISGKNYSLVITFVCSDYVKAKPRLISEDEDECIYEIEMMRPDCKPKCTDFINNAHLIDIRTFPKNFEVASDTKNFSLTLCGVNKNCASSDSTSCEILPNGETVPLSKVETQRIYYDVSKNKLFARGSFKQGRVKRELEVLIKCNWESELFRPILTKQPTRKYFFEVESSYGCIKLPETCTITASDNVPYNLSQLNRKFGWIVKSAPRGRQIILNICGPLMYSGYSSSSNLCSKQFSQVCELDGRNYVNWGSILTSLKANYDKVTAKFVSGSTCKENTTFLYSTEIDFRCSRNENGPVFKEIRGCVMFITWDSPSACPLDYYKSSDCQAIDRLGNRNLKALYSRTDKSFFLNSNTELVYNLCGPLKRTCNDFTNSSFCLKTGNTETVLGWHTNDVISENGLLRMEFFGEHCSNQHSKGEVTLHFVCNYASSPPFPEIRMIENNCKYKITIHTSLACISENRFDSCIAKNNQKSLVYNLAALSLKKTNHIVRDDTDRNIEYLFNICGPVVTEQNVLCKHNTMICMRNNSELNIRKKFTSLGHIGEAFIENDNLMVRSKMGNICGAQHIEHETYFHFKCSQRHNYPQRLFMNDYCVYHFMWETPLACPINCKIENVSSNISVDLSKLPEKILNIDVDNGTTSYRFYLCQKFLQLHANGTTRFLPYTHRLHLQDEKMYLSINTSVECRRASISQVDIEFQCQKGNTTSRKLSIENCIVKLLLLSNFFCENLANSYLSKVKPTTSTTTTKKLAEAIQTQKTISSSSVKHCSIKSITTGYDLNLNEIQSKNKSLGNNQYAVNFDGQIKSCYGVLCKNNIQLLGLDKCPTTLFKDTMVSLHYNSMVRCNTTDFYAIQITLKCNYTNGGEKLNEIDICTIRMELNSPQVCPLFVAAKPKILSTFSNVGSIVGSVIGAVLIVISLLLFYLNRHRCKFLQFTQYRQVSKREVSCYLRDCQD